MAHTIKEKKKRKFSAKWLLRRESEGFSHKIVKEFLDEDTKLFKTILRMTPVQFQFILELVSPHIKKEDTNFKKAISPAERLQVTLAYLATDKKHDPTEIERTIFVGNLPINTKKDQLKSLFSQFGDVLTIRFRTPDGKKLLQHKFRKESEFLNAYIVMENTDAVENALKISGTEFKGQHIRVTKAKKCTADETNPKRIIFVGNLKYSATEEKLYDIFSNCGEIEYVRTLRNSNGCKGVGYVCFKKSESVGLALELNNTILDERPIRVERYSVRKQKTYDQNKQEIIPQKKLNKKELIKKKVSQKKENKDSSKKSQFHGVKTTKKKKLKKNKNNSSMKNLAKKIAPKTQ